MPCSTTFCPLCGGGKKCHLDPGSFFGSTVSSLSQSHTREEACAVWEVTASRSETRGGGMPPQGAVFPV